MDGRSRRFRWSAVWRGIASAFGAGASPPVPTGLHVCPECRRDMVFPLDWEPADDEHWIIDLCCGECGAQRTVTASNAEAAAFDKALVKHERTIERTAQRLDTERMADELDAFVHALDAGLIEPADFAR